MDEFLHWLHNRWIRGSFLICKVQIVTFGANEKSGSIKRFIIYNKKRTQKADSLQWYCVTVVYLLAFRILYSRKAEAKRNERGSCPIESCPKTG